MPRFLHSVRITLARGHTEVSEISATRKAVGSSLFPAPMALMMGVPAAWACSARDSLAFTVSMASTM